MGYIIQGTYHEISKEDFYSHGGFSNPDQFRKQVKWQWKYFRYNDVKYHEYY